VLRGNYCGGDFGILPFVLVKIVLLQVRLRIYTNIHPVV
jgi:hypothetical protein